MPGRCCRRVAPTWATADSTRVGAKVVLTAGLLGFTAAQVLFMRLPAVGRYTTDLLPGFLIVAVALGLAFVGDLIASATDVRPPDAGLASGMINTSQQIGGAIGLAVTTTVAAAGTAAQLRAGHPPAAALTAGFHAVFAVTAALALAGALVTVTLIGRARRPAAAEPVVSPAPTGTGREAFGRNHDAS